MLILYFISNRGDNLTSNHTEYTEEDLLDSHLEQTDIYRLNILDNNIERLTSTDYNESYPFYSNSKNMLGYNLPYTKIPWMWSDQFNLNMQMTGICNEYDMIIQRGTNVEEGLIYFFTKNSIIMGACGLGIEGKIGRDIRLAEKIAEKKIKVTKLLTT